jgi:hypothetical protein
VAAVSRYFSRLSIYTGSSGFCSAIALSASWLGSIDDIFLS